MAVAIVLRISEWLTKVTCREGGATKSDFVAKRQPASQPMSGQRQPWIHALGMLRRALNASTRSRWLLFGAALYCADLHGTVLHCSARHCQQPRLLWAASARWCAEN